MSSNIKTVVLMAALTALLVLIGGLLGGRGGMLFAFFFAVVMNLGTWWFSDSIALRMSGAHAVSEADAPELHQIVAMLAQNAGIPKPAVYVINSDTPNAFATGRSPQHAAVAVTSGITRMLNRDELAGVLAHELAHIKHRDTLISAVVATMAGAITMIANWAQWSLLWGGGFGGGRRSSRDNNGGLAIIAGLLMMILAPIAAMMIQMAISRSREFGADEGGARIMGNPLPLASALEKMEYGVAHTQPMQINQATAHLYIVNPLRADGLAGLFRTHPPTAERIARLEAMAHHTA